MIHSIRQFSQYPNSQNPEQLLRLEWFIRQFLWEQRAGDKKFTVTIRNQLTLGDDKPITA